MTENIFEEPFEGAARARRRTRQKQSSKFVPLVPLISAARVAAGLSPREFLGQLAHFAGEPRRSVPSHTTIRGHLGDVENNDLTKRCTHRFADLIRSFLHDRLKAGDLSPSPDFARACKLCDDALIELRELRYGGTLPTDPGSVKTIKTFRGVYGIWREDTGGGLRQELLVLDHDGKGAARTHATMISQDVVVRGRFAPMGRTIWCQMSGFRDKSEPDARVLAIAAEQISRAGPLGLHALAGVGLGLATADQRAPAVVPLWAIRIGVADSNRLDVDRADLVLRDEFQAALDRNKVQLPKFGNALNNSALEDPVIHPALAVKAKRLIESDEGRTLILPGILDFCQLANPWQHVDAGASTRQSRSRRGRRATRSKRN